MAIEAFKPTDEQRRSVKAMAGYGVKTTDIAICIGVDRRTLSKYFRAELDAGQATANVNLGKSLYDLAVGRPAEFNAAGQKIREELPADKSAAIFMGKARLGLRDNPRWATMAGGAADLIDLDLSVLDDDELRTFMMLYQKIRRGGPDEFDAADDGLGEPGSQALN